jgi:hypothetical protein
MPRNKRESFFAHLRQKWFGKGINWEIYQRLFPHHLGEKDHGYSFKTNQEMNAETEAFNVHGLLDGIEQQITKMGKGYGESFRHIMHRDLHERLKMYEEVARPHVKPDWIDPRLIATHA